MSIFLGTGTTKLSTVPVLDQTGINYISFLDNSIISLTGIMYMCTGTKPWPMPRMVVFSTNVHAFVARTWL